MADDLDALQGAWSVSALQVEGNQMPAEMLSGARVTVEGNRFRSSGMGADYDGTIVLDTSTRPRRIDMEFDSGPEKGNVNRGIYEIGRDGWKLCLAKRGDTRPSEFTAPAGSGFAFETLQRATDSPSKSSKPKRPDETAETTPAIAPSEFEGEWQMVSGILNGQPLPASDVKWVRRITKGDLVTVKAGPQTLMEMRFVADASRSPKTIDYENLSGANKGKSQAGVYEFRDGVLTISLAAPGGARPRDFQPGPDRNVTVWKRR